MSLSPAAIHGRRFATPDSYFEIAVSLASVRPISSSPSSRHWRRNGSISKAKRSWNGRGHRHRLEIDGDRVVLRDLDQPVDRLLRQHHRHDAVLEGVAREDVGEARRDHGLDAHVGERPGGMLAARAAAEIVAGDQDRRRRRSADRRRCCRAAARTVSNAPLPSPSRVMVFSQCAGMMTSVSIFFAPQG